MRGKDTQNIILGLVVITLLAVVGWQTGWIKPAVGGGGSLSVQSASGTNVAITPCGQNQPVLTGTAFYVDQNNADQKTSQSVNFRLYKAGSGVSIFPSTVTINTSTAGLLSCGDQITAVFGDQANDTVNSWYRTCKQVTVDKDGLYLEAQVKQYAAPSITISNNTGTFGSLAELDNESTNGIGTGTYTGQTLRIRAGATSGSAFGTEGWGICTRFNASAFQNVRPAGCNAATVGHITGTATKNTVQCFDCSALGLLENGRQIDMPLSIQAVSGTVPANSSTIDYIAVDKSNQMLGSECKTSFDSITSPSSQGGAADTSLVNGTRIHSDD